MGGTREIIEQTVANMIRIYEDVSALMELIEDKARERGVQAIGYADVTWDASRALDQPKSWLYRWFGRAYCRQTRPAVAAGFCIHLGHSPWYDRARFPLVFPFMTVAIVETERPAVECERAELLNGIWGAGWSREFSVTSSRNSRLVRGRFGAKWRPVTSAAAAFVDLLSLTTADVVERAVVDPMVRLLEGDESWADDESRPFVAVPSTATEAATDAHR